MTSSTSRRRDFLNRWFVHAAFAIPAALGSPGSALINGGGLWATVAVLGRRTGLSRDRAMWLIGLPTLAFCGLYVVAFAVNGGTLDRIRYLAPLLTPAMFPFLYSSLSTTDRDAVARAAGTGAATACYGSLALAAYQALSTASRAEGLAGNPIVFAQVTCLAALVSLAACLLRPGRSQAFLAGAYAAGAAALLLSQSRMSWLALALGTAAVLAVNRNPLRAAFSRSALIWSGLVAAGICLAGLGIVVDRAKALGDDWAGVISQGNYQSSLGIRLGMWRAGAEIVGENPLFGIGPQNTVAAIDRAFRRDIGMGSGATHFHNGLLTAAAEAGTPAATALAAIFVGALAVARTGSRNAGRGVSAAAGMGASILVATATVYLVGGMTGILFGHDILDAVLILHLAVGAYLAAGSAPRPEPPRKSGREA